MTSASVAELTLATALDVTRCASRAREHSVESRKKTVRLLSGENVSFLRSLPLRRSVVVDGTRLDLLHAAPADPLFQYQRSARGRGTGLPPEP